MSSTPGQEGWGSRCEDLLHAPLKGRQAPAASAQLPATREQGTARLGPLAVAALVSAVPGPSNPRSSSSSSTLRTGEQSLLGEGTGVAGGGLRASVVGGCLAPVELDGLLEVFLPPFDLA